MNAFLHFTQKFKMAAKNCRNMIFGKNWQMTLRRPLGVKNFIEMALFYCATIAYHVGLNAVLR